jgi:hypothetical protein
VTLAKQKNTKSRLTFAVDIDLSMRDSTSMNVVHILGLHIKDNHKEAVKGGELTLRLLSMVNKCFVVVVTY